MEFIRAVHYLCRSCIQKIRSGVALAPCAFRSIGIETLGFRLRGRFGFIEEKVKPVRNNYNDYQACPSSAPLKMTGEVSSAVFVKDASAVFVNGQSRTPVPT